ncbi:hypothetical protein NBT05_08250 [Aquimarina sp. ERC-38]|uniref:hypothetical protein n=1 Tax=Aquimarina sp. ERC-38 TaxID=2949996 RepID=UPI002246B947|nr:hypothetical protein [Aquimarina sp. ERC-38]UZO82452.1 hypothetical protein NBT05_08250 [Aquimarina sp. ERC-38]
MDKKNTILDRVIIFADYLNISLRSFSLSIGASPGYLHRLQSAKSNIGGDFIEKIIQLYPQLNSTWLVTGEGTMLKGSSLVQEPGQTYGKTDYFKEALLNYLEDQDVKNKLRETIADPNDLLPEE